MTPKNSKTPRQYHVTFSEGTPLEDNFGGSEAGVRDGALVIENAAGRAALIFAPGTWKRCELETRDE